MKQAPLETEEDLRLVKQYLLLPVLLDVLERDTALLRSSPLKLASFYMQLLRDVQNRAIADLTSLRANMRERGIKVYEQQRTPRGVEARYLCRGYQHHITLMWEAIKIELHLKLSHYLNIDLRSGSYGS